MNAGDVYFRILGACHTPFVVLLDNEYTPMTLDKVMEFHEQIASAYEVDFNDCDDFAWLFKSVAIKHKINGVGFVMGHTPNGLHAWNICITKDKVYQVEPQTGEAFENNHEYIPWLVII